MVRSYLRRKPHSCLVADEESATTASSEEDNHHHHHHQLHSNGSSPLSNDSDHHHSHDNHQQLHHHLSSLSKKQQRQALILLLRNFLRNHTWKRRFLLLILAYFIILQVIFWIRCYTMGRPTWIYGSPMGDWDPQALEECLIQPSLPSSSTTTSFSLSTSATTSIATTRTTTSRATSSNSNDGTTTRTTVTPMPTTATSATPTFTKTWYNYSIPQEESSSLSPRILIAQYTGFGNYEQFLDLVVPIHKAYAQDWKYDYLVYKGYDTALFPSIQPSCLTQAQATFDKIALLDLALQTLTDNDNDNIGYDYLLILDTDTLLVDWQYNLTHLLALPPDAPVHHHHDASTGSHHHTRRRQQVKLKPQSQQPLVAAHRVWKVDPATTWDINAGITFWNLRHPSASQVLDKWRDLTATHPSNVLIKNDDQYFLQKTLLELSVEGGMFGQSRHPPLVAASRKPFAYYHGSLIQHFKRDARSFLMTSLEQRLLRVQESIQRTCRTTNFGMSSSSSMPPTMSSSSSSFQKGQQQPQQDSQVKAALPTLQALCQTINHGRGKQTTPAQPDDTSTNTNALLLEASKS